MCMESQNGPYNTICARSKLMPVALAKENSSKFLWISDFLGKRESNTLLYTIEE